MINEKFDELKLTGNLPSPSGVGLKILQLTQGDDYSLADLTGVIQVDPALTGRVIKVANSTAFAASEPATSVLDAAMRLGTKKLRAVALGFSLVSSNRDGACPNFCYEDYWSRSVACAVSAQVVARVLGSWDPVEAFTCGLLLRIGQLALATVHPDPYSELLENIGTEGWHKLLSGETRAFHIHHLEVTAAMMKDWGMPEDFTTAVLFQQFGMEDAEDPTEVTPLSQLIVSATVFADACAAGCPIQDREWLLNSEAIQGVCETLGLDEQQLCEIASTILEDWPRWSEMLEIPVSTLSQDDAAPDAQLQLALDEVDGPTCSARVLAVDDDPKQLRLLVHHLTKAGYETLTASNGEQALRITLEQNPDIVVTDWMMPGLSGIELCEALRQTVSGRKKYVLLLTARETEEQIIEAFNAGADDYVCKPFNPRILLARVQAGQRLIELQHQVELDKQHRMQQVAEMGRLTRKLRAAALTDVLTELPNRRYAMKRLAEEWSAAVRGNRPLSVIMVDIDNFKQVNDVYGHDVGDVVLRETAQVLRARTRRGDVVCRLGGEEFLVININSTASTAAICAERLRAATEAHRIEAGDFHGSVTVSLGLAELAPGMRNAEELLKAADKAVYQAKDGGRNQVVRVERPDETGGQKAG